MIGFCPVTILCQKKIMNSPKYNIYKCMYAFPCTPKWINCWFIKCNVRQCGEGYTIQEGLCFRTCVLHRGYKLYIAKTLRQPSYLNLFYHFLSLIFLHKLTYFCTGQCLMFYALFYCFNFTSRFTNKSL